MYSGEARSSYRQHCRSGRGHQGCPRPKFTTLPVQVQVPAVVVVPVQVDETKPAVVVVPVQVDETKIYYTTSTSTGTSFSCSTSTSRRD